MDNKRSFMMTWLGFPFLASLTFLAPSLSAQTKTPTNPRPAFVCSGCLQITIMEGNGQSAAAGSILPHALVVQMTYNVFSVDSNNNPISPGTPVGSGFGVEFSLASPPNASGASLSAGAFPPFSSGGTGQVVEAYTDDSGNAQIRLTLGSLPGQYQISAGCPGCIGAIFNETASAVSIHIETGIDHRTPNQAMLALATVQDSGGRSVDMQDAAQELGFDHFNWLQIITSDLGLEACAVNSSLAGCSLDFTINAAVPSIPTVDPPEGGYAYELCPTATVCQTRFPVQDFWPMYLDEYFASVGDIFYLANPDAPEYIQEYRAGNALMNMGGYGQSPGSALGFSFSDVPSTNTLVPGTAATVERISFVTALVGVTGACNVLVSSNCAFQIIPGTTFNWTSSNGIVSFTDPPSGPRSSASITPPLRNSKKHRAKQLDDFPLNPVDLTGQDLNHAFISLNQFLTLANLAPQTLSAIGGSISNVSASLIPNQAATLAAVQAGATLVSSSQVSFTASGLSFSRVSQTFNGTLTLTNISGTEVSGALQILFTGMPASVTLDNATGSFSGIPYLTVPTSALAAGQSITASLRFKNPLGVTLNLNPTIYFGSFN
jgi:hypothetical protein